LPRKALQDAIVRYPQLTLKKDFQKSFGRIYGDFEAAEEGQFPFIGHLQLNTLDGPFLCDSSILDDNTLVTAAHCLEDLIDVTVTAGAINWRAPGPNAQIRVSDAFAAHEEFIFSDNLVTNDIGYIKVDEAFDFSGEYVQPIIVAANEPAVGSLVTAIGFGATNGSPIASASNTLNYATDLVIVEDDQADIYANEVTFEQFVCTFQSDKGTCGGDSGGPIIDADGNLFGAVSFGSGNCEIGPSCFTSIPYFREWLNTNADTSI